MAMSPTGDDAVVPLSDTGGPSGFAVDRPDHIVNLLARILFQLSPATTPNLITYPIGSDGVQTLFPPPMPVGLQVWALKNNSASPVFVWFQRTTSLPQNYLVFASGEFRAYLTSPTLGIYCMRTAGDASANVTLELWY
jgi:hypothetical protein